MTASQGGADVRRRRWDETKVEASLDGRYGVLARSEWLSLGWTDHAVRRQVETGQWSRAAPGIAVVRGLDDPWRTRVRVAFVAGGRGATIGGHAAATLLGIVDEPPRTIEVQVPHGRTPAKRPGVRFRHVRRVRDSRPWDGVRVTTPEETVLDLVSCSASATAAVRWIDAACGRRLTTPQLLLAALEPRVRMPYRAVVVGTCARVADGEQGWLERCFAAKVVRAHRLPEPRRQGRHRVDGRVTYADAEFEEFGVIVELDGRLGHDSLADRYRDLRRDNAHVALGRSTLRYGYDDTLGRPCAVAAQLAAVLQRSGWRGTPRRCGGGCALT